MINNKIDLKELKELCKDYKLLYVEDDESSREASLEMFEIFFRDIDIAIDGQDGLDKFNAKQYDIVITDINMPKLNGIEMFKAIRDIDNDIPVLILSARNEVSLFLDTIMLGVNGYLMKPLDRKQFLEQLLKVTKELSLKDYEKNYKEKLEKEVEQRTKELDKKLRYDNVTGLLNRYSFFERLKTIDNSIIFIIDIDKFKIINEYYGDSAGTLVLQEFAKFLLNFTKNTTYEVYRLAGDEFILINTLKDIDLQTYKDDVKELLKKIEDFKISFDDDFITIDLSIGVSTSQTNIFESAEIALNYAKIHKKPFVFYTKDIDNHSKTQDAFLYKKIIKNAINTNNIVPLYQPIVNSDGKIVKYETLMRLRDSDGKLISPFFFLDIAIKTKLYDELSSTIIFFALDMLKNTTRIISMNFTYDDIKNKEFLQQIESFMIENEGVGKRAIFEIVESQNIENYDDMQDFITRFRKLGVKFAIDDFGSGFSNFEYILKIEPDFLKIDGSLVKNIDTDKKAHILVKAIVQFSHELGIEVIAEYVCNENIFLMLKEMGVDAYQGFYFYEPLLEIQLDEN